MKTVKSVGVIGVGVVGKAVARTYLEHCDVRVHDLDPKLRTHLIATVMESDVVFVCLPTPGGDDGRLDTSIVDDFFGRMEYRHLTETYFVLKSTVPIGTTERLRERYGVKHLVHSPEFLTARCSYLDASLPSRNVVGGRLDDCSLRVASLLQERFPGAPTYLCSSMESEAIKLITNAFYAVKVAFFNEAASLVNHLEMNWETVRKILLADGRIHPSHTDVPGPDGLKGFGGSCLPKDAAQFASELTDCGMSAAVTHAALDRNEKDRGAVK